MSFSELNVINSCLLHRDQGEGQAVRDFLLMILFLFKEGRQCWNFFILLLPLGEVWAVVSAGDGSSRVMGQGLEQWHCMVTDILCVLEWFSEGLSNLRGQERAQTIL